MITILDRPPTATERLTMYPSGLAHTGFGALLLTVTALVLAAAGAAARRFGRKR